MNGRGGHLPKVLIQVTDTGSGMSPETQSHMFEPFFSTKEMNVGLGLTAVYGIVKHSAGQVDVVSRPGEGTVVRVALPLEDRAGRLLHQFWHTLQPKVRKRFCWWNQMKSTVSSRSPHCCGIAIRSWRRARPWKRCCFRSNILEPSMWS